MALSIWEALTIIPALSWVLGKGVVAAFLGPLRMGRFRLKPWSVFVQQRIFYTMFATLSARQLQYVLLHPPSPSL
jgi:hypothetical protein